MDTVPSHDRKRAPLAVLLALAAACGGCATGRVVDGVYENSATGFRIPVPPAPWVSVSLPDVDVAFQRPSAAGTIAAFSECGASRRAPLRVLARRLFFGLKERRVLHQEPLALDGAEALRTVIRAEQDGSPVVVESVVARRGACGYDLVLAAPPDDYPALRPDFDRVAAGWRALPPEP